MFMVGTTMSEQWRILVVEDEEQLNRTVVTALQKDGYVIQGARSGAEAIRLLWTETFDVVIGDLKSPGADGLELLQWLRAFRPGTRMIMVSASKSSEGRTQALQNGVASFLEKPIDLHILKEELRRLLQQTGFTASLDSFDLLDVIQIITLSRKSIALLVNTGLEERGVLYFQDGELVWAEYGTLYGEEAFFALAAHKNGTVVHQPWQGKITPNVTQPLSRLILQALHYRAKYADGQQGNEPQITVQPGQNGLGALFGDGQDIDDTPFMVLSEASPVGHDAPPVFPASGDKEWWEQTGKFSAHNGAASYQEQTPPLSPETPTPDIPSIPVRQKKTYATGDFLPTPPAPSALPDGRSDLPSWLTEQPTKSDMPVLRPSGLSNTSRLPVVPPPPAEWRPPAASARTTAPLKPRRTVDFAKAPDQETAARPPASPEWQPIARGTASGPLRGTTPISAVDADGRVNGSGPLRAQRAAKRNYAALVAALQTLGYSLNGFVAAAVAGLDGQPIAQVAIDDLDIAPLCNHFSYLVRHALLALGTNQWGGYQDTVITGADRYILLRLVGEAQDVLQVLITTRETDPSESLAVMISVEGAIEAALH